MAQALLAKRLGKKRIIAETGAGQHGVATATVCARFGLECIIYMGAQDMERQALNVFRMKLLGAEVCFPYLVYLGNTQSRLFFIFLKDIVVIDDGRGPLVYFQYLDYWWHLNRIPSL